MGASGSDQMTDLGPRNALPQVANGARPARIGGKGKWTAKLRVALILGTWVVILAGERLPGHTHSIAAALQSVAGIPIVADAAGSATTIQTALLALTFWRARLIEAVVVGACHVGRSV